MAINVKKSNGAGGRRNQTKASRRVAVVLDSDAVVLDALIVATAELDPEVDRLLTGDRAVGKLRGLGCDVQLLLPAG